MDYAPNKDDKDLAKQQKRRGFGLTSNIRKILGETDKDGYTNYETIARKVVEKLKDEKIANRDWLTLLAYTSDRVEGKAIGIDIVGHMNADNPLMQIDTNVLLKRVHAIEHQKEKIQAKIVDAEEG